MAERSGDSALDRSRSYFCRYLKPLIQSAVAAAALPEHSKKEPNDHQCDIERMAELILRWVHVFAASCGSARRITSPGLTRA